MNLDEYNIIALKDWDTEETDKLLALNKKHSVKEFQEEINRVKELLYDARVNDEYDDDDWSFIEENISSEFDWFEIYYNDDQCVFY